MIFLLLAGLILELIYCYYVFGKDLFSPSAILCEVFILSTIACIFNIDVWGVNLGVDTLAVILGGNAVFIIASTIVHLVFSKKNENKKIERGEELNYINIKLAILILVAIAYLVFSVIYAKTVISILGTLDYSGDMANAMAIYRSETFSGGVSLPIWLVRMDVVLGIGIYVLMYVFINNIIVDRKKKSNYLLLVAVVAYLISSVFTAQRTTILLAFIFALFVTYTLLNRKYRFVQRLNAKYVFRGVIILVAFLALFGATRGLFGRQGEMSPFDNVTYYTGNSIESLDLFIKSPLESRQFGEETFRQFRVYLSEYGLAEETTMRTANLEFRQDANGNRAGNVYTGYRYYIHDFGYGSMMLFQVLTALFYGVWYEKLRHRELKKNIDLSYILFAWFVLELFRFSLMARFFDSLAAFLFTYWYIFLFWKVFLGLRISLKHKKSLNSSQRFESLQNKIEKGTAA